MISFDNASGGIYSGTITLGSGTTIVGLRDFYNTATARNGTISGVIAGSGALATTGGGALVLSGSNSYSGGTIINGDTITFSADNNREQAPHHYLELGHPSTRPALVHSHTASIREAK